MSPKAEFIERFKYINTAISLPALIDNGIALSEHNNVANLLRKGLSIVAFNILEDYIKNKSIEGLTLLSSTGIPFSNLPDFLQESSIVSALSSLSFHSNILKKENSSNYKTIIQEESRKISSTASVSYELSKYSLLFSNSNITSKEIPEFLKAFGILGGWDTLKSISNSVGGGIPDLAQAFTNASQRRHNSAHAANFNYAYLWLENLKSEIISISASIDIAISARCRQAARKPMLKLEQHRLEDDLNFRFLEIIPHGYKETKHIGGRSIKNWHDIDSAFLYHAPRVENRKEFLIVLDSSKRIIDWLT